MFLKLMAGGDTAFAGSECKGLAAICDSASATGLSEPLT